MHSNLVNANATLLRPLRGVRTNMCSIGRIAIPAGPAAGGAETCIKYRFWYSAQQEHGAERRPANTTAARFCRTCRVYPARHRCVATGGARLAEDVAVTSHANHLGQGRQAARNAGSRSRPLAALGTGLTKLEETYGVTRIRQVQRGAAR